MTHFWYVMIFCVSRVIYHDMFMVYYDAFLVYHEDFLFRHIPEDEKDFLSSQQVTPESVPSCPRSYDLLFQVHVFWNPQKYDWSNCSGDDDCFYGQCSSGDCICDDGWFKDSNRICARKPCGDGEIEFESESCYQLLSEEEADSEGATQEYIESEAFCHDRGYRLPHIGSSSELQFFYELFHLRFPSSISEAKAFMYAECTGNRNEDNSAQCHWKGWSSDTVKYVGKPSWAQLNLQTCNTNCQGLCAHIYPEGTDPVVQFIACRTDVYAKPVFCERPILYECFKNSQCNGDCEVGRCRCTKDSHCDGDKICQYGGCVNPFTTILPPATTRLTTTQEISTSQLITTDPTTAEETTLKATTPFVTTTEETTIKTTTPFITTAEETTMKTTIKTTTPFITTADDTTTPFITTAEDTTTPFITTAEDTTTPFITTAEDTTTPFITTAEDTTTPFITTAEDTTTPFVTTAERTTKKTTTPVVTTAGESTSETTTTFITTAGETTESTMETTSFIMGGRIGIKTESEDASDKDTPNPTTTTFPSTMKTTTEGFSTTHSTTAVGSTINQLFSSSASTTQTTTEMNPTTDADTTTIYTTSKVISTGHTTPHTSELTTTISTEHTTPHTSKLTTEESPTSEEVTTTPLVSCSQSGGVLYKSSCYWEVTSQSTHKAAEVYCGLFLNSSLVSIESEGEQLFLERTVSSINNYWIGLTYKRAEDLFVWSSREPFVYDNFNEQSQSAIDSKFSKVDVCFSLDRTNNLAWNARYCNVTHYFICERTNSDYEEATTQLSTVEDTTTVITTELTTTQEATTQVTTEPSTTEPMTTRGVTTTEELTTEWTTTLMATTVLTGCDSKPCLNGGTCADFGESFICRCDIGYGGTLCEEDLTPDFDPSLSQEFQIEDLVPENYLMINPYYVLGLYHFPLLVSTENLQNGQWKYQNLFHFASLGEEEVTRGRVNVGTYPVWTTRESILHFTTSSNPLQNLRCSEDCSEGFAVSVWLLLLKSKGDNEDSEYLFHISTDNFVTYGALAAENDIIVHVTLTSGYQHQILLSGAELPSEWFSLAISWHPDTDIEVYVNGQQIETAFDERFISNLSPGSPSVSFADFTIWDRYLNPFEAHRFVGMDADEFKMVMEADFYWSLDAYVRRDHLTLLRANNSIAMTTTIETADLASRKVVPGRNGKGYALEIGDKTDQWLQLGMHEGNCLSNPELCTDGLTLATWMKLNISKEKEFHCLLSSGGQSSRGVALYLFGENLRAVLADGGREWITEISMENVSSWTHLAISWKRSVGMFFYLNGELKAADWVGFRRIRPSDLDFGLTVGRRNDFLGDFARLTLEEVAVWFHIIHPWQARERFGFPENPLFAEADISWDAMRLLSGDFKHLSPIRLEQSYGEPAIGVKYGEEQHSISLSPEYASLTLAVPKYLPSIKCLGDIELCVDGISLSLWMNIASEVNMWWPNGVFQIISGREGFAVQLTQRSLVISLSLTGIRRDYSMSVLNIPVKRWFNLVATWSQYEDLAVYINGIDVTFDSINEVVVDNLGTDFFLLQSQELKVEIQLHNIAVWQKYYYPKKIWQLVGVSESLLSCIHLGAYCWSFDKPSSLMFPYQISDSGVQQVDNQYSDGIALMTDNTLLGEVNLGDYQGECPHVPSLCEGGFSVSLWIKPVRINSRKVAHLISLGADVSGEVGFFISQSKDKMTGSVSNGTVTWEGTIPGVNITYDEWMYLAMLWIPDSGLLLVVNGHVISSQSNPLPDVRASQEIGTLVLGGRVRNRRLEGSYEEVMLLIPRSGESLPSPEYFTGSGGSVEGYASADNYFDLTDPDSSVEAVDTTLTEDRFSNDEGAADTSKNDVKDFGYVTVGDFPFHCLSDPAMCHPAGLTISLWLKIGPIDHFQDPTTNSEGVGYILSSGAQNDNAHGYAAHYNGTHVATTVKDGVKFWMVTVQYIFGKNWTNYALGWNEADGLNVFLDGEVKGTMKDGIILSTPLVEDGFTQLQLGKRNDGEDGYLGAAFDDVAIWIYTFSPDDPEVSKTLKGEETKEEEIVVTEDHEELIKQAPLTWKVDCQVIHEADCARDINELLEIVNDQEEYTLNATKSIYGRLLNLTTGKTFPDSSEVEASIKVMDTMSQVGLPPGMGEDDATRIYESFAESVSNLLEDDFSYLWQNISERQFGVAALMENLETLGVQVASVLPVTEGYTGCSRLFRKNRLMTCMDRFPIETYGQEEAILPPLANRSTNGTNSTTVEGLFNFTDSITLPKNLFRFAKSGDIGSFVFSHFDNIQDIILSNMSDELPVQYTGEATVNSRILSLAIDPPLRRDLYNPVVIALEYHQQFDNNTMKTVCAFWNFTENYNTRGSWDTNGCELMTSTDTHIFCSCNHLTHFAIVSSPIIPVVPNPHHGRIAFMGLAIFIINLFFLLYLMITLIRHRRLHTMRNSIHLQQCLAVVILGLSVVMASVGRNSEVICNLGAMLFQYAALAIVIWITVEALQLAEDSYKGLEVTDKKYFNQCDDRLKIYYATAWGLPILVVATTVATGVQPHRQLGSGICFLTPLDGILWAFFVPLIVGIVSSVCLLLVVARFYDIHIKRQDRKGAFKSSVIATCILIGYYFFAWIFGSEGLYGEVMWAQYIFVFMLTFLGIVLFLVHGIGNVEVRALLFCEDPDIALTDVQEIYIIPEEIELPPKPEYKPY